MKGLLSIWLGLALGIFAAFHAQAMELKELEAKHGDKRYEVIDLSAGRAHYQLAGKDKAPVVVMVHGVSGPLQVWDKVVDAFVEAGFRVLRYDIYGRGFSERLDVSYDLDLYTTQLSDLLQQLEIDKISLVGSSMGAIVSSRFATLYAERVKGVSLIGPAGFPIQTPFVAKFAEVPVLGDMLFYAFGESVIQQQNRKYFVYPERYEEFLTFFADQLSVPGTAWSMRSTMRHVPVRGFEGGYRELAAASVKVQVIWGRKDATFPYENYHVIKKLIPHAEMVTVEDSAHLPQFERPQVTLEALLPFVRSSWLEE